jgi:hypothetical protein
MPQKTSMKFARWISVEELPSEGMCFVHDGDDLPESLLGVNVVLSSGTEGRAGELLARGADRVLLGDLALLDSSAVARLVEQFGNERIGVWLAAQKTGISWSLDVKAPNAGFKCMMPSVGVVGWDVLKNDGTSTGTDAEWWVGQMLALGASIALVSMDMQDDDLNICAGLIETHGDKLWFSPRLQPNADLELWVHWGQVRQLVLPTPNERDDAEMARICSPVQVEVVSLDDEAIEDEIENVGKMSHEEHTEVVSSSNAT